MRVLVVVLTVAGGVLPLFALAKAWRSARRRFRTLDEDLRRINEIIQRGGDLAEVEAVRAPLVKNWGLAPYAPDIAERTIFAELARPAIVAVAGILFATAGSLLSLCL